MTKLIVAAILVLSSISTLSSAHPGRTDSNGGHKCSQKSKDKGLCTGYHYHKRNLLKSTESETPNYAPPRYPEQTGVEIFRSDKVSEDGTVADDRKTTGNLNLSEMD
jgi:hypothetical protein